MSAIIDFIVNEICIVQSHTTGLSEYTVTCLTLNCESGSKFTAEMHTRILDEMSSFCRETFGPTVDADDNFIWSYNGNNRFLFADKSHAALFTLRFRG
jgi:hypothetical protein